MLIGNKIRIARVSREMTQKELGMALNFPEQSAANRISQYEKNEKIPKDSTILELAKALQVSPYSFMMRISNPAIALLEEIFWFEKSTVWHRAARGAVSVNADISCSCALLGEYTSSLYRCSDRLYTTGSINDDILYWGITVANFFRDMVKKDLMYPENYLNWKLNFPYNFEMIEYFKMYHKCGFGEDPTEEDMYIINQMTKMEKNIKANYEFMQVDYDMYVMYDERPRLYNLENYREKKKEL